MWRHWCIWSSWALLPMAILLLWHKSPLGLVYVAAAAAACAYHWHREKRFQRVDHVLAWTAIAVNCWLAAGTSDLRATLSGVVGILLALLAYSAAHIEPEHYDRHHTQWHLWCGFAGWMLAQGYVA